MCDDQKRSSLPRAGRRRGHSSGSGDVPANESRRNSFQVPEPDELSLDDVQPQLLPDDGQMNRNQLYFEESEMDGEVVEGEPVCCSAAGLPYSESEMDGEVVEGEPVCCSAAGLPYSESEMDGEVVEGEPPSDAAAAQNVPELLSDHDSVRNECVATAAAANTPMDDELYLVPRNLADECRSSLDEDDDALPAEAVLVPDDELADYDERVARFDSDALLSREDDDDDSGVGSSTKSAWVESEAANAKNRGVAANGAGGGSAEQESSGNPIMRYPQQRNAASNAQAALLPRSHAIGDCHSASVAPMAVTGWRVPFGSPQNGPQCSVPVNNGFVNQQQHPLPVNIDCAPPLASSSGGGVCPVGGPGPQLQPSAVIPRCVPQQPLPMIPADASMHMHQRQQVQNMAAVARAAVSSNNYHQQQHNPNHNWQATKSTVKERISFMFNNEIQADVHFLVGRGAARQRIPAHKFVLSVGSAVFDAMFNGAMAAHYDGGHQPQVSYPPRDAAGPGTRDIELPDVEASAFLTLLRFLYSDEVQIGPETVMTTLYTAKKYAVPALENACVDFLKRNLSPDNAFMLLTQARLFDEPQLAALCLEMIDKHTSEALGAESFTDVDLETMCAVLERDTLRIREVLLFQHVSRWSTQECNRQHLPSTVENQRHVLGRALSLIRFPLMRMEEFAQNAAQSGILTDREVVNLFLYFTVNPKPSVAFLDVPRCCVTGKEQVVNRFQRIEGRWGYSGSPDRIKFTVDRRIFIVGFGLYGSIHGPNEYQVNIQIIHVGSGKVAASNDTSFQCDGTSSTFRVLFKEPVEISPVQTYIASATLKGPDTHYGTKGLRRIVHQSSSSGCVTFQFTYAAGNNNGTSVEDGQIPEIIFYTKLNA